MTRPVAVAFSALGGVLLIAALHAVSGLPWAHPIARSSAGVLSVPVHASVSVDPTAAQAGVAGLLSVLAVMLLARQNLGGATLARQRLLATVAGSAAVYAAYALLVQAAGWETVLWVPKAAYRAAATGPFINRNAFACYLGLALLACTGVLAHRARIDGVATFLGAGAVWSGIWLLLAATLLATQSRGGIAATGVALLVWLSAGPADTSSGRRLAMLVAAAAALAAIAGIALDERLAALPRHLDQRLALYAASLEVIAERPWLGHGPGSFADMLAMVGRPEASGTFAHAHNVYLEAAVALGIPAVTLGMAGAGLIVLNGWRAARRGSVAGRVGVAAAVLLATHGAVDFAPQVPAVAITGAAFLGLAAAPRPAIPPAPAEGHRAAHSPARQPA